MKNVFKKEIGITLIALIITIIVLLILAGVTIAAITSNESAPNKAVEARQKNEEGAMKDAAALKATNLIQEYMDKKYVSNQSLGTGIVTAGDYVANNIVGTEGGYTYAVSGGTLTISDTKGNVVYGKISAKGNIDWNAEPPTPIEPLEIGSDVDYSTTLNGVTLDDWKVFYSDGNYTYLIYGDYLQNEAVNITNIEKWKSYALYTNEDRSILLNAMTTKSNWNKLLTGTLNDTEIDYSQLDDTNIWAMGSPTIELWVDSWNESYPNEMLYIVYSDDCFDAGYGGWYIGDTANPDVNYSCMVTFEDKDRDNYTLYFPPLQEDMNCSGYWFSSPSADSDSRVLFAGKDGQISYEDYSGGSNAFRPIIKLPTNVVNK